MSELPRGNMQRGAEFRFVNSGVDQMGSRYQPQVLLDLEFLGMMRTSVSDLQSVAKCSLAALEDAQRLLDAVDMARTLPLFVDWSEAEYRDTGYAQR